MEETPKANSDSGRALAGKDILGSEQEEAAEQAVDTLVVNTGVTETVGMEKVGAGGWGAVKERMETAGWSPVTGETDG